MSNNDDEKQAESGEKSDVVPRWYAKFGSERQEMSSPTQGTPGGPSSTYDFLERVQASWVSGMSDHFQETVLGLEQQVKAIAGSLGEVSASVLQLSTSQPASVAKELEQKIAPMRDKLEDIENSTLPALREVNKHMVEIESALTGAIAVKGYIEGMQGQIKGLQGQVDAFDQRLKTVESQREQARSRRVAVWTIIIAVAGVVVGAVGALGVYLVFFYPSRP
ncbi:MAG TPA: hypothetical protein VJ020_03790 [Anaerolineales bacterium]|nr:hypothetical protein [Anaerolineales bacterium]